MSRDARDVEFSAEEGRLLLDKCALKPELRARFTSAHSGPLKLSLTTVEVTSLRDSVADRLQVAGFDENWDVNPEGRVLEGIIDKLIPRRET